MIESREEAELVVDVLERKSEKQQSYSSDPTRNMFDSIIPEIRYTVIANIVEGDQTTTLSGSKTSNTSVWRIAATELAKAIDDHVEENHERLLLRRPGLPVLGAEYVTITKELKKSLALKEGQGVVFTKVVDGGPAGRADLQAGDIIMESAKIRIKKSVDLTRLLAARKPGDLLVLRIKRAGGDKTVSVLLGSPLAP